MPDDRITQLRKRHPDYTGPLGTGWWQLCRDAYESTGGFRVAVQASTSDTLAARDYDTDKGTPVAGSYLVRYPRETAGQFARRQAVSVYRNHVAPIVQEYAGHLWRRPPQRSTADPEVKRWQGDVDGIGTPVDVWLEQLTPRLQLFGWHAVLVDRPAGDVPLPEARTYARALEPEELVDWQRGTDGNFDWARLCTATCDRDPYTGATVEREEYTTWTREDWQRTTLVKGAHGWEVESETPVTPHPIGRVPVALIYWQRPVSQRVYGTSQVDGVVAANLELFNLCSEQREQERAQTFGVLLVQSDNPDVWQGIRLGTQDGLRYGTQEAAPSWLSPPESIGQTFGNRVQQVTDLIWELAHLERPSAQPQSESGISRQWRFGQTRSVLVNATSRLSEGERDVLDLVLRWRYPTDPTARAEALAGTRIAWGTDFDVEDLETVLSSRLAVLKEPSALTPETARSARLAIGRALNPDASPEEDAALTEQVGARYTAETLALSGSGQTTSQDTALNGAQVSSLVDVVKAAALGEIPRESASQIITLAYPVDATKADAILGPIGRGFVPAAAPTSKPTAGPSADTDSADTETQDTDAAGSATVE